MGKRIVFSLILFLIGQLENIGQGQVTFNNRVGYANIDARVTFLDGAPVREGYVAQLFGGPAEMPIVELPPLYPTTTFRTGQPEILGGYINPVTVVVPNVPAGREAILVMRVFNGLSWESSLCRGESSPVIVTLGSPTSPEAVLDGLQPFQVNCIPEPSTLLLGAFGAAALFARFRARRP